MTIKTNANCRLRTVLSHRGGPGSVSGQFIWDMIWYIFINCNWVVTRWQ